MQLQKILDGLEIEAETGLDFLDVLEDSLEESLESEVSGLWG